MKSVVASNDRFSLLFKCATVMVLTPHSNASIEHDVLRDINKNKEGSDLNR